MTARALTVSFLARDPDRVARFWAALLDRPVVADDRGALLPGEDGQLDLRFVAGEVPKTAPNPVHLHLTSTTPDDQQRQVERALALGGAHVDLGQRPEEGHVVVAGPEGDELCVIEAGNRFLVGCGRLGELACDGTRAQGEFWAAALAWPLVWDEGEETAVQRPEGGTKVSWGGEPPRAAQRHRFEVTAPGDPQDEAERLVALGATSPRPAGGGVALTDPDGHDFLVLPAP